MASPFCEMAISTALAHGKALLKFISANDAGVTGGHQCGFYLPKNSWELFTDQPPDKGLNNDHIVRVEWQDGRATESCVKWYGQGTRAEYRLTRFGRDFPFLTEDTVGNLFVLVPESLTLFHAFVLDREEDIEEIVATLGVDIIRTWGIFEAGVVPQEDPDACIDRRFREFASAADNFPKGDAITARVWEALEACTTAFAAGTADTKLVTGMKAEFQLFRVIERKFSTPEITRLFKSVDDFLDTAQTIIQRRKARAGRALENHVTRVLTERNIPHAIRGVVDGTRPDLIIPSVAAYNDLSYPVNKLFIVGIKTTCKDRWRQVIEEAPRIKKKHILTFQEGISKPQLDQMKAAHTTLIVPKEIQKAYPVKDDLLTVEAFVETVRTRLAV